MKNYFFQQSFCQSWEARPLTLWRLRLAAILLMTIALKALFITLLMWSKLTLSPVWLPTLLSRLTKPISLMLLAILKAGRLRTK